MRIRQNIFLYAGVGIVTAILAGLLGWYLFISDRQSSLQEIFQARGLGVPTPSFSGGVGNTSANLARGSFSNLAATSSDENALRTPRLWRMGVVPTAGVFVFDTATSTSIRYVEAPTGHVFEAHARSGVVVRITNTLVPHVLHTLWVREDILVLQHEEDGAIRTLAATIEAATSTDEFDTTNALRGVYLEDDIASLAVSPDRERLFYIAPTSRGARGVVAGVDGTNRQELWSSVLRGWRAHWSAEGVVVAQKAAHSVSGNAYLLSTSGNRTPLVSNALGLVVLPHPESDAYLYSTSDQSGTELFVFNGEDILPIPLATFAEKCVWGQELVAYCAVPDLLQEGAYPDLWYRGEVALSDRIWRIDATDGSTDLVIAPSIEYGVNIDVLKPAINEEGTHMVFIDAQSRTPWMLRIVEE